MQTKPSRATRILSVLCHAVAALTAVLLFFPGTSRMPGASLDESWVVALNQALPQGLAVGRDVIFTLGPFAPVFTKTYFPATWAFAVGWSMVLAACYVVMLTYISRTRPLIAPLLFAAVAAFISDDWNASFMAFPLLAASALRATLAMPPAGKHGIGDLPLAIAVALGTSILLLMKGSFIPACVVTLGAWTTIAALQRRHMLAVGMPLLVLALLPILWLSSGQSLSSLPGYFRSALPMISGYTEAMSAVGRRSEIAAYLLVAAVIVAMLVPRSFRLAEWPRWAYLASVGCTVLMAFKAGFVRHDGHAMTAAYVPLIAALLAVPWYLRGPRLLPPALALIGALYISGHYASVKPLDLGARMTRWAASGIGELAALPGSQARLNAQFADKMATLRDHSPVPRGDGQPADIYSYNQSYLIAQGWKWRPRPIFQSYSVYTPALNEKNRDFLLSDSAPRTIFYAIQPIDNRYAAQEDSLSLPVLLGAYRPVRRLPAGFLQLEREVDGAQAAPQLHEISRTTAALGQSVAVPPSEEATFVQLHLRKTALGALKSILFKPGELSLEVTMPSGAKTFRLVPKIAESGFILSPDLGDLNTLLATFAGEVPARARPTSFKVVASGGGRDWKSEYEVTFSALPLKTRPAVNELLYDAQIQPEDLWHLVTPAGQCIATIDLINGAPASGTMIHGTSGAVSIDGWGAVDLGAGEGIAADAFEVLLRRTDGMTLHLATTMSARNDVKAHLGKMEMGDIGYHAKADAVPPGIYDIELYRAYAGNYARCEFARPRLTVEERKR